MAACAAKLPATQVLSDTFAEADGRKVPNYAGFYMSVTLAFRRTFCRNWTNLTMKHIITECYY